MRSAALDDHILKDIRKFFGETHADNVTNFENRFREELGNLNSTIDGWRVEGEGVCEWIFGAPINVDSGVGRLVALAETCDEKITKETGSGVSGAFDDVGLKEQKVWPQCLEIRFVFRDLNRASDRIGEIGLMQFVRWWDRILVVEGKLVAFGL